MPPEHPPPIPKTLKQLSRNLRRNQTKAEKTLWHLLRDRRLNGAKFRRQHVFGLYILDFYCHEAQLAIELDGGQHDEPAQRAHDDARTAFLEYHGVRVLRFWNMDVLKNPTGVLESICEALVGRPSPNPLPSGEGFDLR